MDDPSATTSPPAADSLTEALGTLLGCEISDLHRLSGGASRETWSFTAGEERYVLRRDPPGAMRGMAREVAVLQAASAAGLPVPEVIAADEDPSVLGAPFAIMAHVEGETIPRRILRDDAYADARPRLVWQCGEALARLHDLELDGLDVPESNEPATYRAVYESAGVPRAVLDLALRWIDQHPPPPCETPTLVHGDFRLGNLMVGAEGLRAVLDWELVHRGDPVEDLAWFCVPAWRFGSRHEAGGVGSIVDLVSAYEQAGGRRVDPAALRWWMVVGTFKWAVMCIMQAGAHLGGHVRSMELAAIGRRVAENEHDLLNLLEWDT